MGAGHSHLTERRPAATPGTTRLLWALVGAVLAAVVVGAAVTWPSTFAMLGSQPMLYEGASRVDATVLAVDDATGDVTVEVTTEGHEQQTVMSPTGIPSLTFEEGDRIRAIELDDGAVVFSDFERGGPLLALLILYVVLVLAVAWWRGLGALLGLVAAFGIVGFYTIPALLDGGSPAIIGLVTSAGALFVLLYVAHGPNARTTTAYLGTIAGLLVTAVLGTWAVDAARIPGVPDDAQINIAFVEGRLSLSGLALCGLMIAGLGVLNDVTITQASAVWELGAARPDLGPWQLFVRGMRIGRDHIASTVYTIAFAYVGASLPLIMLIAVYDNPVSTAVTSSELAGEVVRTLVGSIGLVLAVPLTTGIGALIVGLGGEALAEPADDAERPQSAAQDSLE
ncbi:YibE/F family protein [Demequina lignilytica]|uniref:YibE/F family protein n=1 Tax=Demequina lignilytica TaxID=3051663 RepID=A0AB35MF00_9MICO|nr:YibE/F family protein [Demequina sp. SYSU T0a273]MDN4482354.1 YibE/F family protein [Demequina sp. SYSU T0a273]